MGPISEFTSEQLSAFQAYSRLTVVAHAREQIFSNKSGRKNDVSFKDFLDILEEKKMVNESLSREVDDWVKETSKSQLRNNNNYEMETRTMDYIAQAYRLGFVDLSGHLKK